jgi:sterol 3beta-glucosyltransferase
MSDALQDDETRTRPRSFSSNRRSISQRRSDDSKTPQPSSESYVQSSMEDPSFSNLAASSIEDASASQILRNSEVFHQGPSKMQPQSTAESGELKGKSAPSRGKTPALDTQSTQRDDLQQQDEHRPPTPTLQSITKIGAYPLQRAGAFAGYLNKARQNMSSLLASESMGYVEKVSGMWKGGRKHYDEPDGLKINEDDDDLEVDAEGNKHISNERFRAHFALPETEKLQATYFAYILRVLPLYGKIYLSDRFFCFRSLLPGTRTKLILPLQDIETVHKEKGFRFGYSGLVVVIRGHEEIFFEFGAAEHRDDCAITMLRSLEATRYLKEAGLLGQEDEIDDSAAAERDALQSARQGEFPEHELKMPSRAATMAGVPPVLDETDALVLDFKPKNSMKITCLTIGSRGDVQPYIALCKGLLAQGHKPRIATHAEFQGWIESHGIEFARVEGDPAELMRLCIENGTFTWAFLREANSTFRGWLDELLVSAYTACEGSELLIESPSAMAGIHIAEKLGIPYFRAFTMPWTRTRAYPHAFIMPEQKLGGAYNYMTYVMFDNIFWKAIAHQVNRWRNNTLGLPNTSLEKLQPNKVPFLYNFSPSVVAPPLDFSDWIRVTGYWFLDEADKYTPPPELQAFIKKARDDGKKLVYVGFGSIIVNDPAKMTQEVIDAVLKSDVRCILSKGWSERITSKPPGDAEDEPRPIEPEMPPEIHVIKSAPHDWLFRQIDAAAHHGGSGTTGASLRAGIPTIIRPFFGDQYFFAGRVEDLGVGVWVKKWGTNAFGRALWEATRNERMIVKARVLGEEIRNVSITAFTIFFSCSLLTNRLTGTRR